MPDRPSPARRAAPQGPSRPSSLPDPFLDDLEEPLDEDLDPLLEWPDDEPLDEDIADEPLLDDPDPLALEPGDDAEGTLDFDEGDDPLDAEPVDAFEPVVLPWRTRARLPDHDLTVEAVLDPTRERTRWVGGAPGRLRIVLGGLEAQADVEAEDGPPLLRVGRDVLAGRILVES